MNFRPGLTFRLSAFLASIFSFAAGASAQFVKFDDLASRVLKEVKPYKPRLVAVADFRSPDQTGLQGHYFAWLLSNHLKVRAEKKFEVTGHQGFDDDLAALHVTVAQLVPGVEFRTAASGIGADILVTGSVERRERSYVLKVVPIHVADEKVLGTIEESLPITEFTESLVTPFPGRTSKAEMLGVAMPVCIHCPDPGYSDLARSEKISGTAILLVQVLVDGTVGQIRPQKMLGYGLDEKAYYAIKNWKLKPAMKDGNPVAVVVPVEVSFRLY